MLVLFNHFARGLSKEIWIRTGTAKKYFVAVHVITLPRNIQRNLPAFHVLTGCDTVSQFRGHCKKSSWKVFKMHAELLNDFSHGTLTEETYKHVEEFICRLYSPGTNDTAINDLRFKVFQKGAKALESLPTPKKSLQQHIRRSHYQSKVKCTHISIFCSFA